MNQLVEPCSRCKVPAEMPFVWMAGSESTSRVVLCVWCDYVRDTDNQTFLTQWGKEGMAYALDEEH